MAFDSNITENERKVLKSIAYNSFADGNSPIWSDCINDSSYPSNIEGKTLSGVVSSLVKKGWIYSSGKGQDSTIGYMSHEAYIASRGL